MLNLIRNKQDYEATEATPHRQQRHKPVTSNCVLLGVRRKVIKSRKLINYASSPIPRALGLKWAPFPQQHYMHRRRCSWHNNFIKERNLFNFKNRKFSKLLNFKSPDWRRVHLSCVCWHDSVSSTDSELSCTKLERT